MSMEQAFPRFERDIRPLFRSEDVIDAGSAPWLRG
jgi:hypothetical protein